MKFRTYTEMTLDSFLKLPRLAQLLYFEKINKSVDNARIFEAIGFDTSECKSPIEQILLFAYEIRLIERNIQRDICLAPQYKINVNKKTYYADFCFDEAWCNEEPMFDGRAVYTDESELKSGFRLIIECDGHDYHHATKQQVKRDYERETDLKLAGFDVLRFTGSQIYEDPYKCADTIINYILKKIGDADG